MRALVLGAGGFIGSHLVRRLKREGFWVRGVDLTYPEFSETHADEFVLGDLRDSRFVNTMIDAPFDEIYQLAADMGGAGYLFTGEHDANIMHNSASINLNVLQAAALQGAKKIFYSSSACVYPEFNQMDSENPTCEESTAYPANPDSEYGWEKLFSERLYFAYAKNYGIDVSVARYHNVFGPEGAWRGGREKAPAALCRKIASADKHIEVWGDGQQTRSFLYIDECIEGTLRLMRSGFQGPVNIGSDVMITINDLAKLIIALSGKEVKVQNIEGPTGVRGRNSDNTLIQTKLNWVPTQALTLGLEKTYAWVSQQVCKSEEVIENV